MRGLKPAGEHYEINPNKSHPTWVRGLKRYSTDKQDERQQVAPHVGAWIETTLQRYDFIFIQSHPTWVRGLKPHILGNADLNVMSHPTWVRGLKRMYDAELAST